MAKNIEIKNCFEFVCPENWNNFEKTDDENVRFCGSCKKQVFKATDKEILEAEYQRHFSNAASNLGGLSEARRWWDDQPFEYLRREEQEWEKDMVKIGVNRWCYE